MLAVIASSPLARICLSPGQAPGLTGDPQSRAIGQLLQMFGVHRYCPFPNTQEMPNLDAHTRTLPSDPPKTSTIPRSSLSERHTGKPFKAARPCRCFECRQRRSCMTARASGPSPSHIGQSVGVVTVRLYVSSSTHRRCALFRRRLAQDCAKPIQYELTSAAQFDHHKTACKAEYGLRRA
jgi:hypothetical protein